jgi:acetoacetate decarboxylase
MESEPAKQVDAPAKTKKRWWLITLKAILLIFVVWLFFRRTGCEQRDVRGTFQEFYGIFTAVEPANLELYRSLLPDVFDMPEQPGVGLFVVNYNEVNPWPMIPYLEGAVVLRASYKGEEGWHVITMPVTERVPCEGGRYLGFPKYVTDVTLWPSRGKWRGVVKREGTALLTLEYTPGIQRELTPIEEEYLQKNLSRINEPVFQLVPPGEGPKLNKIRSVHLVPPTWSDEVGMVRITIDKSEPWAGLIAPGAESIGFLQKFDGGSSLVPNQLN